MVLSLVNSKVVIGHGFARSPNSMLLNKEISTDRHKCTIWYGEEASSQEYKLCMPLIGNGNS
jgi:hypothetical protein